VGSTSDIYVHIIVFVVFVFITSGNRALAPRRGKVGILHPHALRSVQAIMSISCLCLPFPSSQYPSEIARKVVEASESIKFLTNGVSPSIIRPDYRSPVMCSRKGYSFFAAGAYNLAA